MSLLGVWTKTPGRAPARPAGALLRPERGRDIVALLNLLAVDGVADDGGDRLVGVDDGDLDLAEVFGHRLGPEEVELHADEDPVVGTDGDLHRLAGPGVDLEHLALDVGGDLRGRHLSQVGRVAELAEPAQRL